MQATVHHFDPATASGTVVTDAGVLVPFDRDAFATSGLFTLRPGQRLTLRVSGRADGHDPDARVIALGLGTVGRIPEDPARP
ncbi:MAG: hypothetical protein QG608_2614 [Actinomycetota bacterium]|nr:hypothetical protein [Actinomycetota bacterium]